MTRRKISLFIFLILISSVSIAFASLAMVWPVGNSPSSLNHPDIISLERQLTIKSSANHSVPSASAFNYQAWRRIQTSA